MLRDLIPWTQLTRLSIPDMQVARRPLTVGEVTLQVGEAVDPSIFRAEVRKARLRQFYNMRLLEPIIAPKGSRQAHRTPTPVSPTQSPVPPQSSHPVPALSSPLSSKSAVIPSVEVPITTAETYIPPRKAPRKVVRKGDH